MGIFSHFSLQNITTIRASTFSDLESAPLMLTFEGDDSGWSEITIHTNNKELSNALVDAINGAVISVKDKQDERAALDVEAAE